MTTTGVLVVVPPELETGFLLAGVETVVAQTAEEAKDSLSDLMDQDRGGVVAVYEPFLAQVGDEERARLEASTFPVVVPLPAGLRTRGEDEGHRARISAMLSRAVGYHITFGEEGEK